MPAVYAAVQQSALDVPDAILAHLQRAYYETAATNVMRLADLERILAALADTGAPVLLLKGAALAEPLYGNLALRLIGDLDLLVSPQYVSDCRKRLIDLGFLPTEVEERPGAHMAYRSQQGFQPAEPFSSYTELHWHLIEVPFYLHTLSMDWFWTNTLAHDVGGCSALVLNPEANLLYLSAHLAFHHRFHGLHWFLDLALLVHKHGDTLDWDLIIRQAQRFELLLALRETLRRLANYWPSLPLDLPLEQMSHLQPAARESRLFRLLTAEPRSPHLDFYTDILSLPDLPARARFVGLNLFPQRAYMIRRYGTRWAKALPFLYLYRLGEGLVQFGRTIPQLARLGRQS
jgi:hypothetical protein